MKTQTKPAHTPTIKNKPMRKLNVFTCPSSENLTGTCEICYQDISGHDSDYHCLPTSYKKPAHTPTPWKLDGSSNILGTRDGDYHSVLGYFNSERAIQTREENKANAAYIVRAVNAHEGLVELLREFVTTLDVNKTSTLAEYSARVYKAIAQAEGR